MLEIAIRTRSLSGYVRIGNGVGPMVDWNEIARQKNEERTRVTEAAANRDDERTRRKEVIAKFAGDIFNLMRAEVEQRNMDILLPGQRISVNPTGPLGVQIALPHKGAIMHVEIEPREEDGEEWSLNANVRGLGANGMPDSDELAYDLSVVGFDVSISRPTGNRGDFVLTRETLSEHLLGAFAYYAS